MLPASNQSDLRRQLIPLFHSMDFVARHPALKRDTKESPRSAEIYLALQCRHRGGWRKLRDTKYACKVCGLVRGVKEYWRLLPRAGRKVVGWRAMPNSKRTFPNRKAGTVASSGNCRASF